MKEVLEVSIDFFHRVRMRRYRAVFNAKHGEMLEPFFFFTHLDQVLDSEPLEEMARLSSSPCTKQGRGRAWPRHTHTHLTCWCSFPQEGGELRAGTMDKSATTRLETCLCVPTPVRRPPRYLVEKALVPDREKLGHPTGATTRSVSGTSEIGTDKGLEE